MTVRDIKPLIKTVNIDGEDYKIEYTNRALMAYEEITDTGNGGQSVFALLPKLAHEVDPEDPEKVKPKNPLFSLTFREQLALMWCGLLEHNPDFPFEAVTKRPDITMFIMENLNTFLDCFASVFQQTEIEKELPEKDEAEKKKKK